MGESASLDSSTALMATSGSLTFSQDFSSAFLAVNSEFSVVPVRLEFCRLWLADAADFREEYQLHGI